MAEVNIVIVDDDESLRTLISKVFTGLFHCEVLAFGSGSSALSHFGEGSPADIIISDVEMEGISGLELLAWVREHFPDTVFIVMSGNPVYGEKAEELGASGFLTKPIGIYNFLSILEDYGIRPRPKAVGW